MTTERTLVATRRIAGAGHSTADDREAHENANFADGRSMASRPLAGLAPAL